MTILCQFTIRSVIRLVGILLLCGAGCQSQSATTQNVRAKGTVYLDDKPLTGGTWKLDFVSTESSLSTVVGKDGTFQIPSMPPGKYQVAISAPPARSAPSAAVNVIRQGANADHVDEPKGVAGTFPSRYSKVSTSEVTIELGGTSSEPIEIRLKSK